jgi:hypothetical protein
MIRVISFEIEKPIRFVRAQLACAADDGKTLTVTSYGINSTPQNEFVEYDPVNNAGQELLSFKIKRLP